MLTILKILYISPGRGLPFSTHDVTTANQRSFVCDVIVGFGTKLVIPKSTHAAGIIRDEKRLPRNQPG